MEKTIKNIDTLLDIAYDLAIIEIQSEARKLLQQHPELIEFIMAMGSWDFSIKNEDNDRTRWANKKEYPSFTPLIKFINRYDSEMKLTGDSMRFTADGPVVTSW